jgi:hypothetical protein
MDAKKVKGVANYPPSTMPTKVRRFLGFMGYYEYFHTKLLKNCQTPTRPQQKGNKMGVKRMIFQGL